MIRQLVDLAVAATSRHLCAETLQLPDQIETIVPHELLSSMVTYVCTQGLVTPHALRRLLQPQFRYIAVPNCIRIDDECVNVITAQCPHLTALNVSRCYRLTDLSVERILQRCEYLESLLLNNCYRLTDEPWLHAAQTAGQAQSTSSDQSVSVSLTLPRLHTLDIGATLASNATIERLGLICPSLTSLCISGLVVSTQGVVRLLEQCSNLVSLATEECRQLQAPVLSKAAEHCLSLQTVLVSGCYLINDAEVEALVSRCRSLSHLSIRECNQLRDASLKALAEYNSSFLTHLDMCWTGMRTGLVALADSPTQHSLKGLHLSWCQLMDEQSLSYSLTCFRNIAELNLSWRTVSDGAFGIIVTNLPLLTDLDISGCSELTPAAFEFFKERKGNDKLLQLTMAWCRGLNDDGLSTLASVCPSLVSLDLAICSRISDRSVAEIGRSCPLLRRLVLSRCEQLTDTALETLSGCSALQTVSFADMKLSDFKLHELTLSCRSLRILILSGCNSLTSFGVESVALNLLSLKSISLSGCILVQDDAIKVLVDRQKDHLHTLNLCQTGLTDEGLAHVAAHCHSLQALHISFCEEVSDDGIAAVSQRLADSLHTLHVSCCTRLTDLSLIEAACRLEILTDLNVNGVASLSPCFADTLIEKSKYLRWLDVTSCRGLCIDHVRKLKKHFSEGGRKFQLLSDYILASEFPP